VFETIKTGLLMLNKKSIRQEDMMAVDENENLKLVNLISEDKSSI
jgi:hypothetical protein